MWVFVAQLLAISIYKNKKMKKNLMIACVIGFMSFFANTSQAQISVNFNVGAQPLWKFCNEP